MKKILIVMMVCLAGCASRNEPGENKPYDADEAITCPECQTVHIPRKCEKNDYWSFQTGSHVGIACPECRHLTFRRPLGD